MSGQKKGLLGRFGRLFVQPVAPSSGESAVEQTDGEGDNPLTLGEGATMLSVVGAGKITASDPDLLGKIRAQVNGSGDSPYAQFLVWMEKLEKAISDPATLVRAVLVATGLKPEELVDVVQKVHLPKLNAVCESMIMARAADAQQQIGSRQAELARIADGQKILRHQLEEMEQQLLAGESRVSEINAEIETLHLEEVSQRDNLNQIAHQIRVELEESMRMLKKL